ncbi:MAG: aminotransferase class V-fold PLP-dependent enzyme [Ilumatobacteraceae bacterium]
MSNNPHASHWNLAQGVNFLNHGSFGAVPREVEAVQNEFQHRANTNPNRWFRFELPELLIAARQTAAEWFGVAEEQFAFVPNASQGVITAVQALVDELTNQSQPAHIVATSLGYGGVQRGLQRVAQRSSATLSAVVVRYPDEITVEIIASRISEAIQVAETPTIVVLDLITSDTGVLLPVAEIIAKLKAKHPSIRVVIDGAHGTGMLEFPLPTGFDVWVGNFHKWMCSPRPSAGLVCANREIAQLMAPLAPSWDYELGFPVSFDWQGTSDYSAYLATPRAIEFQQQWTYAERNSHNTQVVDAAAKLLRDFWEVDPHVEPTLEAPWMRMVQLPIPAPLSRPECNELIRKASVELNTETTVMSVGGHNYVRLSAHMYNELSDYERLADLPHLA